MLAITKRTNIKDKHIPYNKSGTNGNHLASKMNAVIISTGRNHDNNRTAFLNLFLSKYLLARRKTRLSIDKIIIQTRLT
ncbi:MAG: hypothetical protein A2Y71_05645 [Bacteroidetes bacterium RBG_13_42_15]|nr:MAG: hypothetical protein A2Y71_05645 [Bacteroidetes bacterium RBG_13_42_15]